MKKEAQSCKKMIQQKQRKQKRKGNKKTKLNEMTIVQKKAMAVREGAPRRGKGYRRLV